jgi:hypothetical protein
MGAPVRESDEGEPSKNEPLKSEPSRSESLKSEIPKPELSKNESSKNQPPKDEAKNNGAAPSSRATEVPEPPWKRKTRRPVFEGDVAVVELRSRLALAPERIPEPAAPVSPAPTFFAVLRLMGGVLTAATMAGVAGYLWGFRLSTQSPQLAPASGQASVRPALSTAAANLKASNPDSERPSGPSTQSPQFAPAPNQTNALPAPSRPAANLRAPNPDFERPSRPEDRASAGRCAWGH